MPSLQKKINYEGDFDNALAKTINLKFEVPVVNTQTGRFVNITIGKTETIFVTQANDSTSYQMVMGKDLVHGEGDNDFYLLGHAIGEYTNDKKLENLFIKVNVHYFVGRDCKIGEESVEAICFWDFDLNVPGYLNPVILFINKIAFIRLLRKLAGPDNDELFLLTVISVLTKLKDNQPTPTGTSFEELESLLLKRDRTITRAAFQIIEDGFDSLYDFPLTIPEIKTVDLGGTFTLKTSDGSAIQPTDFLYYVLSAEYFVDGQPYTLNYKFPSPLVTDNNSVRFSFSEYKTIFENCVSDISVKAEGLDQKVRSKVFTPRDDDLNDIKIELTHERPNVLTPLDIVPFQDKRLRGQVLELSDKCKCPLKDLTVLVQVRNDDALNCDKSIWRVVGAATTDSSGNFSMPYPFGIYTEAQAITSVTPNHPVCIPITAVKDGNQTISDDFLFLLVEDMDCRHTENGEDCDCHTPKKASRLPDYADLIESDEYTQDIGGSCVNLSTPNRTLSEFNYQAIVRTSDPDVANYKLRKVVSDQSDLDTFARLSAQSARAAQVARATHDAQIARLTQIAQAAYNARAAQAAHDAEVARVAQVARAAQEVKVRKAKGVAKVMGKGSG